MMVDKTTLVVTLFVAAVVVGLLSRMLFMREGMETGTYRAACWSDGDCGPDGRCDDVLGCVPRGAQPKADKMAAGKLLETFAQQQVGGPVDMSSPGEYSGLDEKSMWGSQPAPAPLRPYQVSDDNQLFEFQNSTFKPECCPATISGDTGCVCLTKKQEAELATRGGNRVTLK